MKKILLSLFLLCIAQLSSKAQTYHYFPMDSLETDWYGGSIYFSTHGPMSCTYHLQMYGDTSIDGLIWRELFSANGGPFAYVREDSSKKVFMTYAIFTNLLVFDFAAQVGDPIPLYLFRSGSAPSSYPSVVTAIDTILVGSTFRKRFTVTSSNPPYYDHDFWIEGIGNTRFGLFMETCYGGSSTLCQVLNSDGLIYNLPCYNTTAVKSVTETPFSINTFPNPVTDILHLEIEGSVSKYHVSITDFTGKEIKSFAYAKSNQDIDMSGFPGGIYIFRITNQEGYMIIRKTIKE